MNFIHLKATFLSKYPVYLLGHSEVKSYSLFCRLSSSHSVTLGCMCFSSLSSLKVKQILSSTTSHLRKASFYPFLAVLISLCPSANPTDSLWHVSVISQISCHESNSVVSDLPEWTTIVSAIAERAAVLLHRFTFRMLSYATSTGDSFADVLATLGQTCFGIKKSLKIVIVTVITVITVIITGIHWIPWSSLKWNTRFCSDTKV